MSASQPTFDLLVREKVGAIVRELAEGLLRLAFPPVCAYTREPIESGNLSPAARALLALHAADPVCWRCGLNVGPHVATKPNGCSLCRSDRFVFEQIIRLGQYRDDLKQACLRLKRMSGHYLAVALADQLFEHRRTELEEVGATVVVPVPLHPWAGWRRGYNQAGTIADQLAKRLGLPCRHSAIHRVVATRRQHLLSPTDRRTNVRDAFAPGRGGGVRGHRVLLVDDVLTTGATCNHAAKALLAAGAESVVVAVIARAGQPKQ